MTRRCGLVGGGVLLGAGSEISKGSHHFELTLTCLKMRALSYCSRVNVYLPPAMLPAMMVMDSNPLKS